MWLGLELPWSGNTSPSLQIQDSYSLPFLYDLELQHMFRGLQQRCRLPHPETQLYDLSEASGLSQLACQETISVHKSSGYSEDDHY